MSLTLKNPHSILAVLESRPSDVLRLSVPRGEDPIWSQIQKRAGEQGVPLGGGDGASSPDRRGGRRFEKDREGGRAGVGEAQVREREPIALEELFAGATQRADGHGLWLALDSLQDPHNVGAIFRSAGFFGVQGIVLTQERSAPLTGTAYDVASGGMESVPFAQVVNLQRAFEVAKDAGLWILGSSEHAHDDYLAVSRDRPWLLVLGNEEKGIRRLTEESCDALCAIHCSGKVTSLNVSVAAGILISRLGTC